MNENSSSNRNQSRILSDDQTDSLLSDFFRREVPAELNYLPEETLTDSRQILAEYGNMSSPTVLFILDRLRKQNSTGPIVILGFGPGMIVEAALVV